MNATLMEGNSLPPCSTPYASFARLAFTVPTTITTMPPVAVVATTTTTTRARRTPDFRSRFTPIQTARRHRSTPSITPIHTTRSSSLPPPPPPPSSSDDTGMQSDFGDALEGLLLEALRTYYDGTPLFTDDEFNTLRDELHHLGMAQVRLSDMERLWVQATSSRDLDRRIRQEFDLSEDDLRSLKTRLRAADDANSSNVQTAISQAQTTWWTCEMRDRQRSQLKQQEEKQKKHQEQQQWMLNEFERDRDDEMPLYNSFVSDAEKINAAENVKERIEWLLFSDATEERLKIMLLYLPAVVMCFVTASVFTILFALLDGEMQITLTTAGRFRLGILSYLVVAMTFYLSNKVTPIMLDYLDLGQPFLMRGACPNCRASVSCLFTGAARVRDERKCSVCGSVVGFNKRWNKLYLVSKPAAQSRQGPD